MNIPYIVTPDPKNTRIKDTNFRKYYSQIEGETDWDNILPSIQQAAETYVVPLIGQAMYDALCAVEDGAAELPLSLREKLRTALAHYTIYLFTPMNSIRVTDRGLKTHRSSDNTAYAPSQWATLQLRQSVCQAADTAIDSLLGKMEAHTDDTFTDPWTDSDEYGEQRSDLFTNSGQIAGLVNNQRSRKAYVALLPYLREIEARQLVRLICSDQYDAMIANLSPDSHLDQELLDLSRKYVMNLALYQAIPRLAIVMDGSGFKVVSTTDGMRARKNLDNQYHWKAIEALQAKCLQDSDHYAADIQNHLALHAEHFTAWATETGYDEDDAGPDRIVYGDGGGVIF